MSKHTRPHFLSWFSAQQTVEDDNGSLCGLPSETLLGNFMWGIFYPDLIAFYCTVCKANLKRSTNACYIDLYSYSDMDSVVSSRFFHCKSAQKSSVPPLPRASFLFFNEARRDETKPPTQIQSFPTTFPTFRMRDCFWRRVPVVDKGAFGTKITVSDSNR